MIKINRHLELVEKYLIYSLVFLIPLLFGAISENPFVTIKLAVLIFGVSGLLLIKSLRTLISGKLEWSTSPLDVPIAVLAIAYVASTYFQTPNIMEALLLPGVTTAFVGSALLYFFFQQLNKEDKATGITLLYISSVIFSVVVLLSGIGLFKSLSFLPTYIQSDTFTPVGGYLPSALFLGTMLPVGILYVLRGKDLLKQSMFGVSSVLILFALGLSLYSLIPSEGNLARGTALNAPGFGTSWDVAIDSLKEAPLLGMGPANYLTAFNRFRPIEYNLTDLWRFKFSTAQNYYLTVVTETGFVGLAGLVLLLYALYRTIRTMNHPIKELVTSTPSLIALLVLLILMFFFPASTFMVIILFVLLGATIPSEKISLELSAASHTTKSRLPAALITLPILILVGFSLFWSAKLLSAEFTYRKALQAIAENKGVESYDLLRQAISKNPRVDRYHSRYSQVNIALANTLAAQVQNGQISDDQRSQITQLVQQAIREARVNVQLNPTRSNTWEQLARTYQTIAPLAQGADIFASQSFRQAIALDPFNPNLRIALGQVHYAAGDYTNAIEILKYAVRVKPDLANAYFNLAFALRENGEIELAKQAMTNVLANLDKNTSDYASAVQVLEDLENQQVTDESELIDSENLDAPENAQDPVLDPQIELTEEDTPPADVVSPTPSPANAEDNTVTPLITPTPLP